MIKHVLIRARRVPLWQLEIDTLPLCMLTRRGWQCDIPRVSDPALRFVTRTWVYATRSFVVLASWIETNERKPGHSNARTLSSDASRERAFRARREKRWKTEPRAARRGCGWGMLHGCIPLLFPVDAFEKFPSGVRRRGNHFRERQERLKYRSQWRSVAEKFGSP